MPAHVSAIYPPIQKLPLYQHLRFSKRTIQYPRSNTSLFDFGCGHGYLGADSSTSQSLVGIVFGFLLFLGGCPCCLRLAAVVVVRMLLLRLPGLQFITV